MYNICFAGETRKISGSPAYLELWPQIRGYSDKYFSDFSIETYVVGTYYNALLKCLKWVAITFLSRNISIVLAKKKYLIWTCVSKETITLFCNCNTSLSSNCNTSYCCEV